MADTHRLLAGGPGIKSTPDRVFPHPIMNFTTTPAKNMLSISATLSIAINDELERQRSKITTEYAIRAVDEIKRFNMECTALRDNFKHYEAHTGFTCAIEKRKYIDKLRELREQNVLALEKLKRAYKAELCYCGLAVPPDLDLEAAEATHNILHRG